MCDGILHVNMFHYFRTLYYMYIFLQNSSTMNILDLVLYHMLFLQFALVNPPPPSPQFKKITTYHFVVIFSYFFISSQWGFLLHKCCHLTRIFSSSCESPNLIALFFVFFLDIAFNFEINVWLIVFLTWSSSYSFTYSPIIISHYLWHLVTFAFNPF